MRRELSKKLKRRLTTALILIILTSGDALIIYSDASKVGLAIVLIQNENVVA